MAGTQTPGPYGSGLNLEPIDAGTLARTHSDEPGMVGQDSPSCTRLMRPLRSGGGRSRQPNRQRNPQLPDYRGRELTVSLSFIVFEPITLDPSLQLAVANEIFTQCGITFVVRGELRFQREESRRFLPDLWLPHNQDPIITPRWQFVASMPAVRALPGRIKVFFVRATNGDNAAYSIGFTQAQSYGNGERIYVADSANPDTLAHELGHVLLDHSGFGEVHHSDQHNLMHGLGRVGNNVTPEQAEGMRTGARRVI
jgi:hypothetical protein